MPSPTPMLPPMDEFLADLRYSPPPSTDLMPDEYLYDITHPWFNAEAGYSWTRWTSLNWQIPFAAVGAYTIILVALVRYMRKREPMPLARTLLAWNFGLALFSCVGMLITVPRLLLNEHSGLLNIGFYESVCGHAMNYGAGWCGLFVMLFIYSKFIELIDTVWLALKKRPMTLLHVWHHITVLLYCWHAYATRIGSGLWFAAMNYLVHTIMYAYFGATSLSPAVRKAVRPYAYMITLLQLLQMVVGIVVTTASLLYAAAGHTCHVNRTNSVLGLAMYASYFILFLEFFIRNNVPVKPKGKRE
eukprot:m.185170 g.185170  ORF g.185170 m.185170 type:complete len:302 (-) comp16366_c0_seq1:17-922(-)